MGLRISLLGPPIVDVDGEPLAVDTRKAIALLAYLATTGRPQSRDHLLYLLWPDADQERARAALRRTLSTLKAALGDRWIAADRNHVSLDTSGVDLDVHRFRDALADARDHGHAMADPCPECAAALTRAAATHGGGFMDGFALKDGEAFEEWQYAEAETLRRELTEALDALAGSNVALGRYDEAISAADRLLATDPLNEAAYRRLIQLHASKGDRAGAIQQYRRCVAVLERELGVAPLPETTALYEAVVQGEVERHEVKVVAPERPVPAPVASTLVGRGRELQRLRTAYDAIEEDGTFIVVAGEAGIGKTRLVEELIDHADERGATAIVIRAHEGESTLAYGVVAELLRSLPLRRVHEVPAHVVREVARLIPELAPDVEPVGALDEPGARTRLYDAARTFVTTHLRGDAPALLFVDDMQWADAASLELFGYLVRRLSAMPVCVIAAIRSDEITADAWVTVAGAARDAITLDRLTPGQVRELAQDGVPDGDAETLDRVVAESEGIPLFVVEYLAALAASNGDGWVLPTGIRNLFKTRLETISETARQVLSAAAVIDRDFDVDIALKASGRSDGETIDAIEELERHGLIGAIEARDDVARYGFRHDRLRAFVYDETSVPRRRLLHRRVAEALSVASRRDPSVTGLVARHLELAGDDEAAATAYFEAATYARSLFAPSEALAHLRSALALGYTDVGPLHEAIGDVMTTIGDYGGAVSAYETAAATSEEAALPRIEQKIGNLHGRRGDWGLSESHLRTAIDSFEALSDTAGASRATADLSRTRYHSGDATEAARLAQGALELAQEAGDEASLAQTHNILGILATAAEEPARASEHLNRSLELAERLGDAGARVAALNNLALAARAGGDLKRSIELTEDALEICRKIGDRHRGAALHNNLADLFHALADEEASMEHLKSATKLFAEIGESSGEMLPEVWKLVSW
ncbi:MAG: ATP-binding protein [Actinomycetota bacterium]